MDSEWKETKATQLEHLAKSAEADIDFNWPVGAQPGHAVIPREWETVASLRAKAALFREIASYFREPPVATEDPGYESWERARKSNCLHSFDDPDGEGMRCVKCSEKLADVMRDDLIAKC